VLPERTVERSDSVLEGRYTSRERFVKGSGEEILAKMIVDPRLGSTSLTTGREDDKRVREDDEEGARGYQVGAAMQSYCMSISDRFL
jgi:hypothetical protein